MNQLFSALAGYLLGSISFSILLSHLRYRDDIRRHGSGNAGMTNILRTYGKLSAALVLVGDFLKGTAAAALGMWLGGLPCACLGGLCAVVGHLFPVFFGFRGGKGVATSAGVILVLCPPALALLAVLFLGTVVLTRYVSLGSVLVAGAYPLVMLWFTRGQPWAGRVSLWTALINGLLVIWMHRANIGRLLSGTESKVGQKKEK